VAGTIHTACFEGRFDGNLVAHQLTGTVSWRRGFSQTGSATGTGTPRYIQLSVPWVDVSPCPDGICKVGGFQLILAR
jgi:hypothetical protein